MHAGPVRARREHTDEIGLVHTWQEELVGETMGDGPVMLSWHEGVESSERHQGNAFNVVIHEFVHILDGLDGEWNGTPPLKNAQRDVWQRILQAAFDRFDERTACGYDSVMDEYAAHDLVEFFAVSSEAFFTQPIAFLEEQPEIYGLYSRFYQQDPAAYAPQTT
jgi:Mlc titration factor MtfA (ptsG expression regulator)